MRSPTDQQWLGKLFDRHAKQVWAYAVRRVGPDLADDIVAEVFATAWRRRRHVPEPALPWLYRVARNHLLHAERGQQRRTRLWQASTAQADGIARGPEDETRILVDSVLAQLPEPDAEVLRLVVWEELTAAEIAAVLNITPGAARNRLMRARRRAHEAYLALEPHTIPTQEQADV